MFGNKGAHLFVTGDPGSGKSTIARQRAEAIGVEYFSTGDYIREVGLSRTIKSGEFGPDEVVQMGVRKVLARTQAHGAVIDGFPRRPHQVEELCAFQRQFVIDVHVLVFYIHPHDAIDRYLAQGYARCPECSAFGPAGEICPMGGMFSIDDVATYYVTRRAKQENELRVTLKNLSICGFTYHVINVQLHEALTF